jgi:hypothetical protein
MKKCLTTSLTILGVLLFVAASQAEIRVVSVKGTAAYKAGGGWIPMQGGTMLPVGAKVSTGVRSTAVIMINNNTVTVQPLTIMKVSESSFDGKSSNTRIGLRRGSVRAKVAKNARIKTVFKVSTPVATSSVRGTEQIVIYGPTFGMRVIVIEGTVEGSSLNGAPKFLSGNMEFWQKISKPVPEDLMNGMKDYLANTNSVFISLDEEKAFELFGDDFLNYQPSTRGGSQEPGAMVPVNVYLIWPGGL